VLLRGRQLPVTPWELVLILWFTVMSIYRVIGPALVSPVDFGWDAVAYTRAARALLDGANPWMTGIPNGTYAAPPPSLLPFLPFTYLPEIATQAFWVAIAALSALYVFRRLHLPLWWFLFPPALLAIAAGSSALPLLALLVRGGVVAEAAAVVGRVYSAVPLVALKRWRSLVVAGTVMVVTAPFLGWNLYLRDFAAINATLQAQSGGGNSALGAADLAPVLVPLAIAGLVLLGRRKAAWLAVPALWPNAQEYYAVIALPIAAEVPIATLAMATPLTPGIIAVGVFAEALVDRWRHRGPAAAVRASAPDHRATADGQSTAHPS
jgi:hypothetical protein